MKQKKKEQKKKLWVNRIANWLDARSKLARGDIMCLLLAVMGGALTLGFYGGYHERGEFEKELDDIRAGIYAKAEKEKKSSAALDEDLKKALEAVWADLIMEARKQMESEWIDNYNDMWDDVRRYNRSFTGHLTKHVMEKCGCKE